MKDTGWIGRRKKMSMNSMLWMMVKKYRAGGAFETLRKMLGSGGLLNLSKIPRVMNGLSVVRDVTERLSLAGHILIAAGEYGQRSVQTLIRGNAGQNQNM
jgi:hypothetical protein